MTTIGQIEVADPTKISQSLYVGLIWGGFALATISTGLRFAARFHRNGRLFADDALVMVAWLIVLACSITYYVTADTLFIIGEVLSGKALPSLDLVDRAERFGKALVAMTVFFYVHLWLIKIALLLFFRRLYRGLKLFGRLWYASLFFVIATGIVCIADNQYSCLSGTAEEVLQKCFTESSASYRKATLIVNCCFDILSDAIIIALPVYMLWGVKISLRRKLFFGALFSVTIITMAVAIVRAILVYISMRHRLDPIWSCVWNIIEMDAAMIVAGLASFRSLFVRKDSPYEQRAPEQQDAGATSDQYAKRTGGRFFAQYMGHTADLFTNSSRAGGERYDELSSMSHSRYSLAMESLAPKPARGLHN